MILLPQERFLRLTAAENPLHNNACFLLFPKCDKKRVVGGSDYPGSGVFVKIAQICGKLVVRKLGVNIFASDRRGFKNHRGKKPHIGKTLQFLVNHTLFA